VSHGETVVSIPPKLTDDQDGTELEDLILQAGENWGQTTNGIVCSACAHVHTPSLHVAFSYVFMRSDRSDMRLTRVKCGDGRCVSRLGMNWRGACFLPTATAKETSRNPQLSGLSCV